MAFGQELSPLKLDKGGERMCWIGAGQDTFGGLYYMH
jgi:hypothetical protein